MAVAADDDAEQQARRGTRERELRAEDTAGVSKGQHVAGWRENRKVIAGPSPAPFL